MRPILPFLIVATGLAAAHNSAAQVVAPAVGPGAALSGAAAGVPFPLTHEQVSDLQQKLNAAGFSSGYVDGRWGPITATALTNFQRRHGLAPDGHLTPETVQALDAAVPATGQPPAGAAVQPSGAQQPSSAVATTVPSPGSSAAVGTDAARQAAPATTGQSDVPRGNPSPGGRAQPVPGANSFTSGEARRRIERHRFSRVSELRKDSDGVWRGYAMTAGQRVAVWLDYKGNVGQP